MLYRDFNHFAGDFAPAHRVRYSVSVSTIADVASQRTWVGVGFSNRSCKGPAHAPVISQAVLSVPAVAITGDDLSDPSIAPRLVGGATKHGVPTHWAWYQDRTADLKGFQLNLTSQDPKGSVVSCDVPTGLSDYYQTCCGGLVVFEFNVRGVWSVRDIGWGTITLNLPGGSSTGCNFIGDASRSASSTNPGTVCDTE